MFFITFLYFQEPFPHIHLQKGMLQGKACQKSDTNAKKKLTSGSDSLSSMLMTRDKC